MKANTTIKQLRLTEGLGHFHIGEVPFLVAAGINCPLCGKEMELNTITKILECDIHYGEGRCGNYRKSKD